MLSDFPVKFRNEHNQLKILENCLNRNLVSECRLFYAILAYALMICSRVSDWNMAEYWFLLTTGRGQDMESALHLPTQHGPLDLLKLLIRSLICVSIMFSAETLNFHGREQSPYGSADDF